MRLGVRQQRQQRGNAAAQAVAHEVQAVAGVGAQQACARGWARVGVSAVL